MAQPTFEGGTPSDADEDSMAAALGKGVTEEAIKGFIFPWLKKTYQTWRHGKTILILGPARAGKTNLFYYLLAKILNPEEQTDITTDATFHDIKSKTLQLGDGLTVILKKPLDESGHVSPFGQVQDVEAYKPHCILIVLDATTFYVDGGEMKNSLAWLKQFCLHLNDSLSRNRKVARGLKSMFVIINKWDKVLAQDAKDGNDNKDTWDLFELEVRDILDERLANPFYRKGGSRIIRVLPNAVVKLVPHDDSLAKRVRQSILQSLI